MPRIGGTTKDMKETLPQIGRLEWIGIATARRVVLQSLAEVHLKAGFGIVGEQHSRSGDSDRQVTIIQHEHLSVIASLARRDAVEPGELRRNLVISGINLIALKDCKFRVGGVIMEGSGPCSRMEENLGPGGFNAMQGHGGIAVRVLESGTIHVGDEVAAVSGMVQNKDGTVTVSEPIVTEIKSLSKNLEERGSVPDLLRRLRKSATDPGGFWTFPRSSPCIRIRGQPL